MIYEIRLSIAYDYPAAVADARQLLRVRPRTEPGQVVEAASVELTPKPDQAFTEMDFFGNPVDGIVYRQPHRALAIVMEARVRIERPRRDPGAPVSLPDVADAAFLAREADGGSPIHFLGTSRRIVWPPSLRDYAAAATGERQGELAAILALAERIQADFTYEPGATDVGTSVGEAFASRRGVCQDFAHVMIAALRSLGVPAGYVSGFLRTDPPPGRPRLEGADAMHAWARAWLGPDLGWVGFDPTNGVLAGDDHIAVAFGRDYDDIAPVAGVLVTTGPQVTRHSVDVVPVEKGDAAAGET